jgi:3',5'-cyclic AMP phosphodiesterase CpdA
LFAPELRDLLQIDKAMFRCRIGPNLDKQHARSLGRCYIILASFCRVAAMAIRIAHISDLHFESSDPIAAKSLVKAVKNERPTYLIITGDFANNPWRLSPAKNYVVDLCERCDIDPTHVFVVAGNHDYRIQGNFGLKPLGRYFFRKTFFDWCHEGIVFLDGSPPLTLILIDSNPFVRGFARGRFGYSAARRLRTQLKALSQEKFEALRQSTTIAVLHHHPIPVPHEGSDFFLVLQNAETLIQLIAEMDINIVLHGHKHRATFSSLSSSKFRNPNL